MVSGPTKISCDSQSAMIFAENGLDTDHSKHIDVRYCFVEQHIQKGDIEFKYVKCENNLADMFTKALGGLKITMFVKQLGLF